MNIFVVDTDPSQAAEMLCDKHVPKMIVESAQMMASALRKNGAVDSEMPLTKTGKPYKGGYKNHPCTVWAGVNYENFTWLAQHATSLCYEFSKRFNKQHACCNPILQMTCMVDYLPKHGNTTPFAQAMPDEHKHTDAVTAYRSYYKTKTFAKWEKGTPAPSWW